ncbi:hypothetical protein C1I95_33360 [Micromonospora craterilacus]|uniref:Uncharacterized protein n=1 Tax=Micromonospora craterilacus TaxID=1655439 RepID=A0A2W2DJV1_9ACTN|nr:hypothetical protein [Micromonospora craterilacus]PZG04309.1 hypothetical protein C1I95_33360 [Micromonospora craterilacus]
MIIYLVDIEHVTHTCPAQPEPHPFDTRRTVIDTIPGGECRTPVTIRCGGTTVTIPCYRHEPAKRQCGPCRIIVRERTITTRPHTLGVAA